MLWVVTIRQSEGTTNLVVVTPFRSIVPMNRRILQYRTRRKRVLQQQGVSCRAPLVNINQYGDGQRDVLNEALCNLGQGNMVDAVCMQ